MRIELNYVRNLSEIPIIYPFCGCSFHFSLYLSARSLSNFLYPDGHSLSPFDYGSSAFTVLLRLRFFRSIPNSHTACVLNFYHIQWCRLSSIRLSPILRQIYLQLVLKIISHYCYSFIFGKLSFLLLRIRFTRLKHA